MVTDFARTLLVLRHAKAAAGQPGEPDADRRLTGRGKRDAVAAGRWLRDEGLNPDFVLCSAARRTLQTWDKVRASLGAWGEAAEVSVGAHLYHADAQALLAAVRASPPETGTLLLVGHNPASQQFVLDVTGSPGLAFPTCALAVIGVRGDWAAAARGGGELVCLWTPAAPDVSPSRAAG